jgi:hypothetical protein
LHVLKAQTSVDLVNPACILTKFNPAASVCRGASDRIVAPVDKAPGRPDKVLSKVLSVPAEDNTKKTAHVKSPPGEDFGRRRVNPFFRIRPSAVAFQRPARSVKAGGRVFEFDCLFTGGRNLYRVVEDPKYVE